MSVLDFYADRMENVTYRDTSEMLLCQRRGNSQTAETITDSRRFEAHLNTGIVNGDIVERDNGDRYFIVAKQQSQDCVSMQGKRVNSYVQIYSIEDVFDGKRKIGTQAISKDIHVPCHYTNVTAKMKSYDAGLLATTTKKLIFQSDVPVGNLDRIVINERNYQVDDIDTGKYLNLLIVQVSEDTRK